MVTEFVGKIVGKLDPFKLELAHESRLSGAKPNIPDLGTVYADMDGDGIKDRVYISMPKGDTTDFLSMAKGISVDQNGEAKFGNPVLLMPIPCGSKITGVFDYNLDGRPDLMLHQLEMDKVPEGSGNMSLKVYFLFNSGAAKEGE